MALRWRLPRVNLRTTLDALWSSNPVIRWLVVSVVFAGAFIALKVASMLFPSAFRGVWSVATLDTIVILTLGAAVAAAVRFYSIPPNAREDFIKGSGFIAGTALLVITLYVAYASFRNQTRLTAEIALNDEGMRVYQIELDNPELRCLYYNLGHYDPDRCLVHIVSDEHRWTLAVYYVEEVWYTLAKSKEDEKVWGSTYSSSMDFWRDMVSEDPTGLFSYYLVASDGPKLAQAKMEAAGVNIKNLCYNYNKVRLALSEHGPTKIERC